MNSNLHFLVLYSSRIFRFQQLHAGAAKILESCMKCHKSKTTLEAFRSYAIAHGGHHRTRKREEEQYTCGSYGALNFPWKQRNLLQQIAANKD